MSNKIFFLILILFYSFSYAQTDHPFVEHEIAGKISGSESILVDDFNNDSLKDILAYPILNTMIGIYTNKDSLDFELNRYDLGFNIKAIAGYDLNPNYGKELIVVSDSNIHIMQVVLDSAYVKKSYPLTHNINKISETNVNGTYIAIDSLGQLKKIEIDTINFTINDIVGQSNIDFYTIGESSTDSIHIFTYSNLYKNLDYVRVVDTTTETFLVKNNLDINKVFSVHYNNGFNIVCSSTNYDIIYTFKQVNSIFTNQAFIYDQKNKPVLHSKNKNDTLVFHISGLNLQAYPPSTYFIGNHEIYESKIYTNSIFETTLILDNINHTNTMLSYDLNNDNNKEYVLFSDLYDQITIYKNKNQFFNISRSILKSKHSFTMVDFDSDGDLDAIGKSTMYQYNGSLGNTEYTYFENRGDFEFRNHILYKSEHNVYLRKAPLIINFQGKPNVFFSASTISSSYTRVFRCWQDDYGKNQVELLDSAANSVSLYSHNKMYSGDVDGDGDTDIILKSNTKVHVYQNRDSVFTRLINTYGGGGLTNPALNYYNTYDFLNTGIENILIIGNDFNNNYFGYVYIECDSNPTQTFFSPQISGTYSFWDINNYENYEKTSFQDFDFDGDIDFMYIPSNNLYKYGLIKNIGNGVYDTYNTKMYTTVYNGDTVKPIISENQDFENNFKPEIIEQKLEGYFYSKLINDSTFQLQKINDISFSYRIPLIVNDFDGDDDFDFVGINRMRGSTYFENTTCNTKTIIDTSICSGFIAPDSTSYIEASGNYYITIPNYNGCDSTILYKVLNLNSNTNLNVFSCNPYVAPNGIEIWDSNGTYIDTLNNINGCDSIVTIHLTIGNRYNEINEFVCDSFLAPSTLNTWTVSGVYLDTLPLVNGCDSIIEITLEVGNSYSQNSVFTCDSFISPISNTIWYSTGNYYDTIPKANGCDSIITTDLTIYTDYLIEIDTSICLNTGIYIGNSYYNQVGSYIDTLETINFCDSIVILNLDFIESHTIFIDTFICNSDSYNVGNNFYTSGGYYIDTLINSCSFDSIIHLNLIVHNTDTTYLDTTLCFGESIEIGGSIYNNPGNYIQELSNQFGCDSVVLVDLQVEANNFTEIEVFLCKNESITVGDNNYYESGNYTNILESYLGCDSIIYTSIYKNNLTVLLNNGIFSSQTPYNNYKWISCQEHILQSEDPTFTPTINGDYALVVEQNGCIDTSDCFNINNVFIEDWNQKQILVYPNPANKKLIVEFNSFKNIETIDIIDSQGKIIFTKNNNFSLIETLDIEKFAQGVYTLRVLNKNDLQYFRFIKLKDL